MEKFHDFGDVTESTEEATGYDHDLQDVSAKRKKARPRPLSRFCFTLWILAFIITTFLTILSLGLFGVKHAQMKSFIHKANPETRNICILFSTVIPDPENDQEHVVQLSQPGVCNFILIGIAALTVSFIGCLIYNIVLVVLGPKIFSPFRICDCCVSLLFVLVSFTLSVVVTAGLQYTCNQMKKHSFDCRQGIADHDNKEDIIQFYGEMNAAKNILWILTGGCIILAFFNGVMIIVYCKKASSKRRKKQLEDYYRRLEDEDLDENTRLLSS